MSERSIVLVGNPDSGKTNFLARLWLALQTQKFGLIATNPPSDIKYVEEIAAHILAGQFAPRTNKEDDKREFNVELSSKNSGARGKMVIPDVSGEMWKKSVESFEIPEKWMNVLRQSIGAVLFVRILSPLNIQPLDWVNCQQLLKAGYGPDTQQAERPTQISLIELTRFLEDTLKPIEGKKPKVAIIVSAWDLLNEEDASKGPMNYLFHQFPMFAGKIEDSSVLDIKVFGLSIVGGDFSTEGFIDSFLNKEIDEEGYVVTWDVEGGLNKINDISVPIEWLLN